MLQRLTPLQLRAVFDVFDADADGVCTREEVAAGLKLMGVQVDAAALEQTMTSILTASFDDDATPPNSVNFQMFSDWWQRQVILRHLGRELGVPSLRPTIFTQCYVVGKSSPPSRVGGMTEAPPGHSRLNGCCWSRWTRIAEEIGSSAGCRLNR
jgi:hypothetical protein